MQERRSVTAREARFPEEEQQQQQREEEEELGAIGAHRLLTAAAAATASSAAVMSPTSSSSPPPPLSLLPAAHTQRRFLFCGPGRKRYLIALLCTIGLTIVIGMRAEMLGIIANLKNSDLEVMQKQPPPPQPQQPEQHLKEHHPDEQENEEEEEGEDSDSFAIRFREIPAGQRRPPSRPRKPKAAPLRRDRAVVDATKDASPSSSSSSSAGSASSASSASSSSSSVHHQQKNLFKPVALRAMPWTTNITEDLVRNSVFLAYLISSPIGGYLTVNHDSSLLLGCSVATTCGINLFLPLVETVGSQLHVKMALIVGLRLLQGLAEGCLIPAVFGVLRFWAPDGERSTILCLSVTGVSLGPLIGLPVCRQIEEKWGWGVVFYIYANCGLIWCIFWWRLVDERPDKDKTLNRHERAHLQNLVHHRIQTRRSDAAAGEGGGLAEGEGEAREAREEGGDTVASIGGRRHSSISSSGSTASSDSHSKRVVTIEIPWREIFRSKCVFAIFWAYAADDWTFQISSDCMQSYYQHSFNAQVDRTIFLLSIPFLSRSIFVALGGILADFLKMKTKLSWTTIRKVLAVLGFGLKGLFFIALSFAKDEGTATVLLTLSLGFSGLAVAGYAVNVMEFAPNFGGLVMGFANSISTFTGITSTIIASQIIKIFSQKSGWTISLCLAAGIQIVSMTIYLFFASSEEQSWAFPQSSSSSPEKCHHKKHLNFDLAQRTKSVNRNEAGQLQSKVQNGQILAF